MIGKANVKGWRERIDLSPDFKLFYATAVEQAMLDEIAELRKLLGATNTQPERLIDPRQMDLIGGLPNGANPAAEQAIPCDGA